MAGRNLTGHLTTDWSPQKARLRGISSEGLCYIALDFDTRMKYLLKNGLPQNARLRGMSSKGLCYIALDLDTEMKVASEGPDKARARGLPDGKRHHCRRWARSCPEAIFQPAFIEKEASGIHDTTFLSVIK
jgi:hypothetical protein